MSCKARAYTRLSRHELGCVSRVAGRGSGRGTCTHIHTVKRGAGSIHEGEKSPKLQMNEHWRGGNTVEAAVSRQATAGVASPQHLQPFAGASSPHQGCCASHEAGYRSGTSLQLFFFKVSTALCSIPASALAATADGQPARARARQKCVHLSLLGFLSPSASHPILLLLLPILLLPRPTQPPKSLRQASGSLSELSLISLENTFYCHRPRDVSKKESRAFCLFICLFCFVTAGPGL